MTEFTTDGADPRKPIPEDGIDSLAFLDAPPLTYEDGEPLITEEELSRLGLPPDD